jgi:hypothetical protein
MPIYTGSGIVPTDGSLSDFGRGPWASLEEYFQIIPRNYRVKGAEFLVEIPGGYEEYRLVGGRDLVHAQKINEISISNISFWISPAANEKVDTLPISPVNGYRVLHNGIIKDYDEVEDEWVDMYGGTGIALQKGMAIIVTTVVIDDVTYKNQIYSYEEIQPSVFEWRRTTDVAQPNWDLFITEFVANKRRVRDLTSSVVDLRSIQNHGDYLVNSNIANMAPVIYALNPPIKVFLHVSYKDNNNLVYHVMTSDNAYIQVKLNGVFGQWKDWKGEPGVDGVISEFRIQPDGTYFQYKLVTESESEWKNIVDMALFKGDPGDNSIIRRTSTHLQWKLQNAIDWINLIELIELEGEDGKNPEYRRDNGWLQYRLIGDTVWIDLFPLSELKGDDGEIPSFRLEQKLLQYKFNSQSEWTTIADLSDYLHKVSNPELEGVGLRMLSINDIGGVQSTDTIEYANLMPYPNKVLIANYLTLEEDNGGILAFNVSSLTYITVTPNLMENPNLSYTLAMVQLGVGKIRVLPGTGVTVYAANNEFETRTQYSVISLMKLSTNVYLLGGDLA